MTITLHLSDDQARRLRACAAARRQSVEDYLVNLAEREADRPPLSNAEGETLTDEVADLASRDTPPLSDEDWKARLKALSDLIPEGTPPLPDEALRRETMYRE